MDEEDKEDSSVLEPGLSWRERAVRLVNMSVATLLHGVGTGVIGIFIAQLIRQVQEFAYGNDEGGFLEIAVEAAPYRRMLCVTAGGIFGAAAWYWLRGIEPTFVTVEECMDGKWMPPWVTLVNGMIQDIVVALGGSFGREAAPREIAAMWGCVLSDSFDISADFRRILVACGTGAGLAAVYSVPISGVLYTIEHVLSWNISLQAVVPAIVTSCVATYVAAAVVDSHGLYAMQKYSYQWPSIRLVMWGVGIGPIAAMAAMAFRRFVKFMESLKPEARRPVPFSEAAKGQYVRIDSFDNNGERMEGTVVGRQGGCVTIAFHDTGDEESFNSVTWQMAKPEGRRDWRILLAMPTVFLALGILSHDFPSLLGNGRALAEVAIHRERATSFFLVLLFLKAMVTAGSIGAGAAGGTLTPSVALGATLGAVLGETLQYALPDWAPQDDAPMSVISAAAFLAVAMRSPVTSLWLMVEFSAQGVDMSDILAAFHGDFGPLLESKFALGMLLPLAVAVAGANLTVTAAGRLATAMQPPPPAVAPVRMRSSSVDLDLGLASKEEDAASQLELDENTKDICYTTFGLGLLLNTCITVAVAAAAPSCHGTITKVSAVGVVVAIAVATLAWFCHPCLGRQHDSEPLLAVDEGGKSVAQKDVDGVSVEDDCQQQGNTGADDQTGASQWQRNCMGLACATLVAAGGAVVPLAPWVLHVWIDVGGGLTAMAVSTACAVAAAACGAAMNSLREEAVPVAALGREVVSIAVAAATSCAVGTAWHLLGGNLPEGWAVPC